jgi:hypothetical protein
VLGPWPIFSISPIPGIGGIDLLTSFSPSSNKARKRKQGRYLGIGIVKHWPARGAPTRTDSGERARPCPGQRAGSIAGLDQAEQATDKARPTYGSHGMRTRPSGPGDEGECSAKTPYSMPRPNAAACQRAPPVARPALSAAEPHCFGRFSKARNLTRNDQSTDGRWTGATATLSRSSSRRIVCPPRIFCCSSRCSPAGAGSPHSPQSQLGWPAGATMAPLLDGADATGPNWRQFPFSAFYGALEEGDFDGALALPGPQGRARNLGRAVRSQPSSYLPLYPTRAWRVELISLLEATFNMTVTSPRATAKQRAASSAR